MESFDDSVYMINFEDLDEDIAPGRHYLIIDSIEYKKSKSNPDSYYLEFGYKFLKSRSKKITDIITIVHTNDDVVQISKRNLRRIISCAMNISEKEISQLDVRSILQKEIYAEVFNDIYQNRSYLKIKTYYNNEFRNLDEQTISRDEYLNPKKEIVIIDKQERLFGKDEKFIIPTIGDDDVPF